MKIINEFTPIEKYEVLGRTVHVKREDLSCNKPAPPLAKLRGVYIVINRMKKEGAKKIGVFDTRVSKSGWGCAAIANELGGIEITNFYPQLIGYKNKTPDIQKEVVKLGHKIMPMKGGRTAVLYSQAKNYMKTNNIIPMPLGLTVPESVEQTKIQALSIPEELLGGDLVLSIGSGMITSGVVRALKRKQNKIYAISAGMNIKKQRKRMSSVGAFNLGNVKLLPARLNDYYTPETTEAPFPSSPYYDLKAWRFLLDNINELKDPILFYNIGV